MLETHQQVTYAKEPHDHENVPLPITCNGERLWLDDAVLLLNRLSDEESLCVLEIFADGSCNHQEKTGAWAIISNTFTRHGVIEADNIGYVELYAVYMGLLEAQRYHGRVVVYTDSQYVYSNVNWKGREYESLGWKSKSWRKRIPNKELLQMIMPLMKDNVRVEKINRKMNKCADRLARKAMREALEQ